MIHSILVASYHIPLFTMADNEIDKNQVEVSGPQIELSAEKEAEYERITRNLAEMTSGDILRKVLAEGRTVKCYWGELCHF